MPVTLCYGCPNGYGDAAAPSEPAQKGGDQFVLSLPYPNPFTNLTLFTFARVGTGRVRLEVRTLDGELQHLLHDDVIEGDGVYQFRWEPEPGVPPGVYAIRASGENLEGEQVEYAAYTGMTGSVYLGRGVLIDLGVTDADGEVVTSDSTDLPFLFGIDAPWVDEQGVLLGTLDLGPEVAILLDHQGQGEAAARFDRTLQNTGNDVELTVER